MSLRPQSPHLMLHFICRGVLWPVLPPIVDRGRANVGVAQPSLDFGDIGLLLQGIGGCGCSEFKDTQAVDLKPGFSRVGRGHVIDAIGRDAGTG